MQVIQERLAPEAVRESAKRSMHDENDCTNTRRNTGTMGNSGSLSMQANEFEGTE